ncbi:unnamed protein product [Microthlaspi erraticum]|uniref:Reverse transcriptase Ty1/copia-type domain-containing protein n=1 Tax=Microthlaspi erraticum TaxID=1685480 RepID=A0A6D2IIW9_9BRAS|nr:unnamed protein product [Microthlaspi erraticum]
MIHGGNIPVKFWAEAINTACYIINRVYMRKALLKTPYELWKGKTPNLSYFRVFGCRQQFSFQSLQSSVQDDYGVGQCVFDDRSIRMGDFQCIMIQNPGELKYMKRTIQTSLRMKRRLKKAEVHEEDSNPDKPEDDEKVEQVPDTVVAVEHPVTQVHRNHSSSDLIGDIMRRKTRGIKLNYKQMVSMAIIQFECFVSTIEPRITLKH